ncbi:MAG: site-specific integrase [Anaerolineales bacterium]|nr:site-specific integrase [Anaerolineales bacterium]
MASVFEVPGKHGTKRWRVQVRVKGYPVQSATFERKTDANRWAAQTESDIRRNLHFPLPESSRRTLGEAVDRFLRDYNDRRPKSAKDRERHLFWWKQQAGAYLLSDLSRSRIVEIRDRLRTEPDRRGRRRSSATVNRYMVSLSRLLSVAVKEWDWLSSNPCSKIERFRENSARVRYLTEEEVSRLRETARQSSDRRLHALVTLAVLTGARRGELLGLRWQDVDPERGYAILHETKNGERRRLTLSSPSKEVIRDLGRVRRLDSDFIFADSTGRPRFPESAWRTALKKAGIEDFRFHDLRHTAASYMAMAGATHQDLAAFLGHKSYAMVARYTHLHEDYVDDKVMKMNQKLVGG